jgi:type I restriction enzyme S subunit
MTLRVSTDEVVASDSSGALAIHPTWTRVRLGDVADVQNGFPFKSGRFSRERGVPLLRIRDVGGGSPDTFFDGEVDSAFVVRRGDIVIGMDGDFRAALWRGPDAALNQRVCRIFPATESYDNRFLYLALQPYLDAVNRVTSAITVKHLSSATVLDLPLPLPPLAEQKRIVAAAEEAFSKLDAGEAGLRTVRQLLKRMRDAILAAAVTGRLVPQDSVDIPAAKLLADLGVEPTLEAFEDLPATWTTVRLGDLLAEPLANGRSVRSRPGGFPVLRLTCLKGGRIDLAERKEGEWGASDAASVLVRKGDFFVSRGNGSLDLVGRGGLLTDEPDLVAYPDTLIRVRVPEEVLHPALLALLWNARVVRDQLEPKARTTAGIYKVNQSMLAEIRLPLPPPEEQVRIVTEVERQMFFLEVCEHAVDAGLKRSATLCRSVLKAAFQGRLVPQDPTDEPASELLDRIRAERAAAPKTRARRARAKS